MTAVAAGVGAGLTVALVCLRPSRPRRVPPWHPHGGGATDAIRRVQRGLAALGRPVRIHVLRRPHARHDTDRRVGAGALLSVVAVGVDPVVAVLAVSSWALVVLWTRVRRRDRRSPPRSVETDIPELVDLVALSVAAGLTVPEALGTVAPSAPASVREDVADAVAAIAAGSRIEAALVELGRRWGEPGRPLVHALVDHSRYGTPLVTSLERVGVEARSRRRRAAETRARRLPVLLLFPLVLCTLPAFGLLTVAPLVAGTLGSLDGSPLEAPASTAP